MDSLDWSKKYEIASVSRLGLSAIGFPHEQIRHLTDEDMQKLAETVSNNRVDANFWLHVRDCVWLLLEKKGVPL